MQVNVLGAERRRRWSYDEKVRLVEETLQTGETVCGVARRHGVARQTASKPSRSDYGHQSVSTQLQRLRDLTFR